MPFQDPIAAWLGPWAGTIGVGSILLRMGLSILFGAFLGCERATKRHAAGLRTFILVTLAGTMAMLLDESTPGDLPILSAAILVGIAIVSSNSILFTAKSQIKGLTTAVALWASGAMGLSLGAGLYTVALVNFLALICSLSYFPAFEKYLKDRSNHFEVHLELKSKYNLQDFMTTIRRLGLKIDDIESNPAYLNSGLSVYSVAITISSEELKKYKTHHEIIEALRCLDYIYHIDEI